jgi:hypothetical protein
VDVRRTGVRGARVRGSAAARRCRRGSGDRDLEREPSRVDRGAVGRAASGRRRRADRLPRVRGVPAECRVDRGCEGGAGRRGGRGGGARRRPADLEARRDLPAEAGDLRPEGRIQHLGSNHCRDHLHLGRHRGAERRRADAQEHPRQHRPDRARDGEVPEVHPAVPADPLPQPAAPEPHVRTGDGDVRAADAARRRRLHAQLRARRHRPPDQGTADFGAGLRAEDPRGAAGLRTARRAGGRGAAAGRHALGEALVALPPHSPDVRSARRRSIRNWRRSGGDWDSWSCRGTGSRRRRRSSR